MQVDYLWSEDNRIHAINCDIEGTSMEVGVLCLVSCQQTTTRITNEHHRFIVEVPKEFRSNSERVKVFNATLNILSHEQV
jgi:hypothetical protein